MSAMPSIRSSDAAREQGHVSKLTSQFPSTTAAHMTTIHTGLPVGVHGVYEWFTFLPKVDRIIAPLLFSFAARCPSEHAPRPRCPAGDVFPEGDFYPTLKEAGVAAHLALPLEVAASTPGEMLLKHAARAPVLRHRRRSGRSREGTRRGRSRIRVRLPAARRHDNAQARPRRSRGRPADRQDARRSRSRPADGPYPRARLSCSPPTTVWRGSTPNGACSSTSSGPRSSTTSSSEATDDRSRPQDRAETSSCIPRSESHDHVRDHAPDAS